MPCAAHEDANSVPAAVASLWQDFLARHDALLRHDGALDAHFPHFVMDLRGAAPTLDAHAQTECSDDKRALQLMLAETNEQIDVLLDELEQTRHALEEAKMRIREGRDRIAALESDRSDDLKALESALHSLETQNGNLWQRMVRFSRSNASPIENRGEVRDCSALVRTSLFLRGSSEFFVEKSHSASDCTWQAILQEIAKAVATGVSREEALEFVLLLIQQWADANASVVKAAQAQDERRVESTAPKERLVEHQQTDQDSAAQSALFENAQISHTAVHGTSIVNTPRAVHASHTELLTLSGDVSQHNLMVIIDGSFRAISEEPQLFNGQKRRENRSARHDGQLHSESRDGRPDGIGRNVGAPSDSSSSALTDKEQHLRAMQQELEQCMSKIASLTSKNAKLKAKLSVAAHQERVSLPKKTSKHGSGKRPATSSEPVVAAPALNAPCGEEHANPDLTAPVIAKLREQIETMSSQLASREQENLSLLQSLGEIKEKHTESETVRPRLEAQLQALQAQYDKLARDKEAEQVARMDAYVSQVNEQLHRIEQEKAQLQHEKELLAAELNAKREENDQANGKVVAVCEEATETDDSEASNLESVMRSHDQQQREAAARIEQLELQVHDEQHKYEESTRSLQSKFHEKLQQLQKKRSHVEQQQRELEVKCADLVGWRVRLEREFEEYKAASDDAAAENAARIAYLTACVDECSRLADSPSQEKVTTRDIHDILVSLSQNAAFPKESARNKAAGTTALKRKSSEKSVTRAVTAQAPQAKRATASARHVLDVADGVNTRGDPIYELQLCQMQTARLQEQLRRLLLKNDTLESTCLRLELQIEDLKAEVKERMAKESSLGTKHGALKCGHVGLKTHFATLSSRYAQVCEELQLRDGEVKVQRGEMSRIRYALQRKSDLLTQRKTKITALMRELEDLKCKAEQYARAEKKAGDYK